MSQQVFEYLGHYVSILYFAYFTLLDHFCLFVFAREVKVKQKVRISGFSRQVFF